MGFNEADSRESPRRSDRRRTDGGDGSDGLCPPFPAASRHQQILEPVGADSAPMGHDSLLDQSWSFGACSRTCMSALAVDSRLGETPIWENSFSFRFASSQWADDRSRPLRHIGTLWLGSPIQRQDDCRTCQ